MVSTSSATVQAREMDKKRKQTLEKAKANHLSRQLQMRLQYARLKVEHGWQKQNLNEVENLYFHHSHLRGSKPYPNSSSFLTVTQIDPSSSSSSFNPSAPSYNSWLPLFPRTFAMNVLDTSPTQEAADANNSIADISALLLSQATNPLQNAQNVTLTPHAPPLAQSSQMAQHSLLRTPTQPLRNLPLQPGDIVTDNTTLSNLIPTTTASLLAHNVSNDIVLSSLPSQVHVPISPSHINTAVPPTSATKSKKASGRNQPSHKNVASLTPKDMFNFNASSLTYDSFWSGLQSKSYPGLKGAAPVGPGNTGSAGVSGGEASTTPMAPITMPLNFAPESTFPPFAVPSPPLPSSAHSTPVPTPITPPSNHNALQMSRPAPAPILLANNTTQGQDQLFAAELGPWNFGTSSGGVPSLVPASLLTNPSVFPLLASLSVSYPDVFGTQTPVIGVGANPGDLGTTTTPTPRQTAVPTPTPGITTAFVGQQES